MTSNELFRQFDNKFGNVLATRGTREGGSGSAEVRSINLAAGNRLRRAMEGGHVSWYEVVFGDGESHPIRFGPAASRPLSPGDQEVLEAVLHENR